MRPSMKLRAALWQLALVTTIGPVIHCTVGHVLALGRLGVIILNFLPVVTASKM